MILDRMGLKGKVAVITGGSQGLGYGMALALAEAGADVAIVARSADKLQETCERLSKIGRRTVAIRADLREVEAPENIVEEVIERLGRIDILVTAAASQLRKPALEVTTAEWDSLVDVNLKSVYFMNQAVARAMIRHNVPNQSGVIGKIINIASLTAVGAWPQVSVYGTTKGGVVQMTRALALEWAQHGILVNAIGPGTFHTELTDTLYSNPAQAERIVERIPLGRPGLPEDLAGPVVFLASQTSDYVTGQVLFVDGGWLVMGAGLEPPSTER